MTHQSRMNPTSIHLFFACIFLSSWISAQQVAQPIFDQRHSAILKEQKQLIQKALTLREKLPAIDKTEIDRQLRDPQPETLELPEPFDQALAPTEIANHARNANLRAGYCYKCMRCDDWHMNFAGAYAIAKDVIVTCDHVMVNHTEMRDGFFMVADLDGNIAIATAVLARSTAMDAAIIKVAGANLPVIPLNPRVHQGMHAFCFSYPLRQEGFFSSGIVNRIYWNASYQDEDPDSLAAHAHLRINFSTDWAPGSSGSPLFDAMGNVIGHVSTIAAMSHGKDRTNMMMLRTGIPSVGIQSLAIAMRNPLQIKDMATTQAITNGTSSPMEIME